MLFDIKLRFLFLFTSLINYRPKAPGGPALKLKAKSSGYVKFVFTKEICIPIIATVL